MCPASCLPISVSEFASWEFIQKSIEAPNSPKSVLSFFLGINFHNRRKANETEWFRDIKEHKGSHLMKISRLWFNGGPEYDRMCVMAFQDLVVKAGERKLLDSEEEYDRGDCDVDGLILWSSPSVESIMAKIILCDQLARNVFRGSSRSYAYDDLTLELGREFACRIGLLVIDGDNDQSLFKLEEILPVYAFIVSIAIMHSEDMMDQELALKVLDWGQQLEENSGIPEENQLRWKFQRKWNLDHKVRSSCVLA